MTSSSHYNQTFYNHQMYRSKKGADLILGYLFGVIGVPDSVIDFGCGAGGWLKAAEELGVKNIKGLEGPWISEVDTLVPQDKIEKIDLASALVSQPPRWGGSERFHLSICLEVAEHLPFETAIPLVEAMVGTSDFVLFGAAIPGQGGVNHINEQYQSFWMKLFDDHGFECFDIIRPHFWSCEEISEDKRQNPFLYVNKKSDIVESLKNFRPSSTMINVVHPIVFDRKVKQLRNLSNNPVWLFKRLLKVICVRCFRFSR